MPYANPQDTQPKAIDIGEILRHFFEHSPIDKSRGYELLNTVSDEELAIFHIVTEQTDLADQPTENCFMGELHSKRRGRNVIVKMARYDDQHHPIIAMAVFDMDKPTQEEAIDSFALFANETGEGFNPVNFSTYTKQ
ncbi:MAG: hypothetical protein IIA05_08240 [Proteobacteria bacterium]|nr:hypothetical protein [Pseudomonadota bacterium]